MRTSAGAINTATPSVFVRTRPAYEKLVIGPLMIFGEMITGGHYLEVLRLGKQMVVGRQAAPSYVQLHSGFVSESGLIGAFYRGFLPWGLIQCTKGIPVLFVQHETNYQLVKHQICMPYTGEKVSGVVAGAAQAIFVCPFQKVKVSVVACQTMNNMTPWQACHAVVTKHGLTALYDGVVPMMMRRSLDWGIRFGVSSEVKNWIIANKERNGDASTKLSFYELIGCGLVGGACSASTHPIDNIITNSQKPMRPGARRDLLSVIRRMTAESGAQAFTRGWDIKVVDNAYHMMWIYGVGTVAYEFLHEALHEPAA